MDGSFVEKEKTAACVRKSISTTSNTVNGYGTLLLQTLESRKAKLDGDSSVRSYCQGLIKLSQRHFGIVLLCIILGGLIFATLPENILLNSCSFLKITSRVLLPGLATLCLFYWASVTVRKYFDSQASFVIVPVFFVTELCLQILRFFNSDNDHISTYITVVVMMLMPCYYLIPECRNEGTCMFASCLLIINVFDKLVTANNSGFFRYIFINLAAVLGEFLTRMVILPTSQKPSEIEAKISLTSAKTNLKNRRNSAASGTNNRRRTSLPVLNFQAKVGC